MFLQIHSQCWHRACSIHHLRMHLYAFMATCLTGAVGQGPWQLSQLN